MSDKTLFDLLAHGLRDMYCAERRIHGALPRMIAAARDEGLRRALCRHRDETEGHIARLEACFSRLDLDAGGASCDAIDGVLKEGEDLLRAFGDTIACDAAIIFSCQAVEHYEIARYGSLQEYAEVLEEEDVVDLIAEILDQEEATDEVLTGLALGGINDLAVEAPGAGDGGADDGGAGNGAVGDGCGTVRADRDG